MLRLLIASTLLSFFTLMVNAKIILSENSHISVLTCSQGEELYSAFGHSALRVVDLDNHIDLVYNYGTFDFNTPNFYLKFANGHLDYMLSVGRFKRFLPEYYREKRSVTEQILNIRTTDKQVIFDALMKNYQPENRFYKYDFFYDNCATRIFDVIYDNIAGEVMLNSPTNEFQSITIREYLHYYLITSPWIETGLNTILGLPADKIITMRESTYLPYFLMRVMENATINNNQGKSVPLVKNTVQLLEFDNNKQSSVSLLSPIWICSILLLIMILFSFFAYRYKLLNNIIDRLLFLVVGIIGVVISYLWFISDHYVTSTNLNIIWALPTFFYLAFSKWNSMLAKLLLKLHFVFLLLFVLGWYWIPQSFPLATIPVSIILAIRVGIILNKYKLIRFYRLK